MHNVNHRILKKYDAKKREWLRTFEIFVVIAIIIFLLFKTVIGVSVVSGRSMLPNYRNGDIVVFTRINGDIERGQVIAVSLPSGEYYVKRVIATGGDTVDLREGKVYINGIPEESGSAVGETWEENGAFAYPLQVAEGELFVLGDNREESIDSRFFGTINSRNIAGVLKFNVRLSK